MLTTATYRPRDPDTVEAVRIRPGNIRDVAERATLHVDGRALIEPSIGTRPPRTIAGVGDWFVIEGGLLSFETNDEFRDRWVKVRNR